MKYLKNFESLYNSMPDKDLEEKIKWLKIEYDELQKDIQAAMDTSDSKKDEFKSYIIYELDRFIKIYTKFTKQIAPKYWRSSGHHCTELRKMKSDIEEFKKISDKDLENDWVRSSLLEKYNNVDIVKKNSLPSLISICKKYVISNYTINTDGSIDVDGNVDLSDKRLTKIPLKFREVSGYFNCHSNKLISLEGCPEKVGRSFLCGGNNLTTLEFSPKRIDGNFYCISNDIWTFEDFNTSIGGGFICWNNPIFEIWRLFSNTEKFDLLNEIDAIRPGRIIILDRLNEFLIMIGKEPVQKIKGYTCI